MTTLTKRYTLDEILVADGTGLWGTEHGTVFIGTVIEISYTEFEDSTWGFVNVFHTLMGGQTNDGTELTLENAGLPYTDKFIEQDVNEILAANPEVAKLIKGAHWSEQGMQAYGMMNFDADIKGNREDFVAAGFTA